MITQDDVELVADISRSDEYRFISAFIAFLQERFPREIIEKFYPHKKVVADFFAISKKLKSRTKNLVADGDKMDFVREMHKRLPAYVEFLKSRQPD